MATRPWTEEEEEWISRKLRQYPGPLDYRTRVNGGGGGGEVLHYMEGGRVIQMANEIFGYNGWTTEVKDNSVVSIEQDEVTKKYAACATATVRVTLRNGGFHEDIGSGQYMNAKYKSMALDKAIKEAVTDATKRSLRKFGNCLGGGLFDDGWRVFIKNCGKARPKFSYAQLYHPEAMITQKRKEVVQSRKEVDAPPPKQEQTVCEYEDDQMSFNEDDYEGAFTSDCELDVKELQDLEKEEEDIKPQQQVFEETTTTPKPSFYSARQAEKVQTTKQPIELPPFDPQFQSPSLRRTLDQSASKPILRSVQQIAQKKTTTNGVLQMPGENRLNSTSSSNGDTSQPASKRVKV